MSDANDEARAKRNLKKAAAQAKARRDYGLNNRPLPVKCREYVDYDYLEKLSDDERTWLASFSRAYFLDSRKESAILGETDAALVLGKGEDMGSSRSTDRRRRDVFQNGFVVQLDEDTGKKKKRRQD